MFEYEIDGETIVIPKEELKEKLSQNPNAKFVKEVEPGNTDPSPEIKDAPVKENNTASDLETGSSEPPKDDLEFTEVGTQADADLADIGAEEEGGAAIQKGEGIFVEPEDLTGYASNFYTNTTNLLNSNKTSEEKNQLFKKSIIPSNYIKGAVNIRLQENEDFKNDFKNLRTDIGNFSNLNSEQQNNVIQKLFETTFTSQRNSPVASIYDQEIDNIINQTQRTVQKNNSSVINEVNDQWLQTEQGRREQQLETQYGKDLADLEVGDRADYVAASNYYVIQMDKQRFFEKALQNKNIEISKESKEIFSKLYDENQLIQTLTKKASNAVYNYIDNEGAKIRREDMGLSANPNDFQRMGESISKGYQQILSGVVGKEISRFDEIYDNYKSQSESWENLNDNDIVLYKQYNFDALTGKPMIGGRKMTVKEAKKRQFDDMLSKNKKLFSLLEKETKLATALNTLGNNERFVKEINSLYYLINKIIKFI